MTDIQNHEASIPGADNSSAAAQAPTSSAPATPERAYYQATPALDVYENDGGYLILLNVPGAAPESIDVQALGSILQVRARQAASPRHDDVALATFERRFELPSEVDPSSATAKLRDGVLEIQVQKSAAARRVKIPVNAN